MELARKSGICANIRFPFPNHFVYGLFREVIPDLEEISPYAPEIMTWKVMKALPLYLKKKGFESLRNYFSEGAADLKLFQLSQRVADLFDQYLLFRPEMVLGWEKGEESHWQAILWREVGKGIEKKHWAALKISFLEEIKKPGLKLKTLPERISVFGISALPPFHLEILAAVSKWIEVNLFLMNPCREYWGDLLTRRETRKVLEKARGKRARPEDLHFDKGNTLLASMGMLGRDFFELISGLETGQQDLFADQEEKNLLSIIQGDILNLRDRSMEGNGKKDLMEADDSIQVHSCHSPMREVEVLQDRLLSLFEADPTLLPKDILIMTPDIATYSPFIQAVFSVPPDDPRFIPFSIADRGVRQESQLAEIFLSLLDFQGSRFGVSKVLAVLESPGVQKRFCPFRRRPGAHTSLGSRYQDPLGGGRGGPEKTGPARISGKHLAGRTRTDAPRLRHARPGGKNVQGSPSLRQDRGRRCPSPGSFCRFFRIPFRFGRRTRRGQDPDGMGGSADQGARRFFSGRRGYGKGPPFHPAGSARPRQKAGTFRL